jgi:hypothetical protein
VIGCLTAPFRALGCLVVVGGLALGWLYRDQVVRTARGWLQRAEAPAAVSTSTGRPGARALTSAKSKVDSLNGWGADSVVLTPSEFASLVGDGMDAELRRQLDSLRVEPLDGEVRFGCCGPPWANGTSARSGSASCRFRPTWSRGW